MERIGGVGWYTTVRRILEANPRGSQLADPRPQREASSETNPLVCGIQSAHAFHACISGGQSSSCPAPPSRSRYSRLRGRRDRNKDSAFLLDKRFFISGFPETPRFVSNHLSRTDRDEEFLGIGQEHRQAATSTYHERIEQTAHRSPVASTWKRSASPFNHRSVASQLIRPLRL